MSSAGGHGGARVPMRIAQLMVNRGFGGAERSFVDLCLALAARGHPVLALCHAQFRQRALLEGRANLEVVSAPVRGWWDLVAARRLERALRGFRPAVLHAHLARGAYLGGHIARRARVPLVAKTHNYVKLKYYRRVDHFIATTRDQREYLLGRGVAPARVSVIPNFSALAPVAALPPLRGTRPVFVSYGRMVRKKGFDVLLQACSALRGTPAFGGLVLGGDGPERGALEALAAGLLGPGEVRFAGWSDDVATLLDAGDIFVLPSREEPFGITVLEAMARGRPVVSTRTAGPLEVLDADTALLAEPGDAEALGAALREAAGDAAGRERRRAAALARFRERYSSDAVVPRIVELYRGLAGAGPRSRD